jgi:hypothetical protein
MASSRGSGSRPIIIRDSPPKVNSTRKRLADSQLHRQSTRSIKQESFHSHPMAARQSITKGEPLEQINVGDLDDADVQMLPAPTIRHDIAQGNAATAKQAKFEEVPECRGVDLYSIKEFSRKASKVVVVVEGETEQEEVVADLDQIAELESVTEDERTEEEKRAEAEQLVRDDEEFERKKLETARTMAGYMEELRSQM